MLVHVGWRGEGIGKRGGGRGKDGYCMVHCGAWQTEEKIGRRNGDREGYWLLLCTQDVGGRRGNEEGEMGVRRGIVLLLWCMQEGGENR